MKTAKRQKPPADAGIRKTLEKMFAGWSDLDPAQPAPFYAKDPGLVFFDIEHLSVPAGPTQRT
jgi:hypothetical protein